MGDDYSLKEISDQDPLEQNLTLNLLSCSIASGISVALAIVKWLNINHQNHEHIYSHEPHDQNDKSDRYHTLYDCDD